MMPKFDLDEIQREMDRLPKPKPSPINRGLPAARRKLADAAKAREIDKMRKLMGIDVDSKDVL